MIVQLHRLIVCSNKIEYISKCDGVSAQDGDDQVWPAGGEAQVGREPGAARPHVQVTRSMVTAGLEAGVMIHGVGRNVSCAIINQIENLYKLDFILFQYSADEYLQSSGTIC